MLGVLMALLRGAPARPWSSAPLLVLGPGPRRARRGDAPARRLNVAYRDFRYVIPFLVQLWMFCHADHLHAVRSKVIRRSGGPSCPLNPAYGLIANFRACRPGRDRSICYSLTGLLAVAVVLFVAGTFISAASSADSPTSSRSWDHVMHSHDDSRRRMDSSGSSVRATGART